MERCIIGTERSGPDCMGQRRAAHKYLLEPAKILLATNWQQTTTPLPHLLLPNCCHSWVRFHWNSSTLRTEHAVAECVLPSGFKNKSEATRIIVRLHRHLHMQVEEAPNARQEIVLLDRHSLNCRVVEHRKKMLFPCNRTTNRFDQLRPGCQDRL
jgi:hypothetical protein